MLSLKMSCAQSFNATSIAKQPTDDKGIAIYPNIINIFNWIN